MQPSNHDLATRPTAVGRLQWGKRTRRDIRHAAALADEMNAHSFRCHADGSVTFTRRHDIVPSMAKQNSRAVGNSRDNGEMSASKARSRDRAMAHR